MEPDTLQIQACWLAYDIPESADIENPSNELRPIAFRQQKSMWIIQEGDIPYALVARLREVGAEVDIIRFDASEAPKLLRMAVKAIARDIRETVANARRSEAAALARMEENEDTDKALTRYNADRNRIIKTMGRNIRDLRQLAERFNVIDRVANLDDAVTATRSLRVRMLQRAKAYADTVNELASLMGEDNEVVRAGRRSRIPGPILADYADENGANGEKLRSKFFD